MLCLTEEKKSTQETSLFSLKIQFKTSKSALGVKHPWFNKHKLLCFRNKNTIWAMESFHGWYAVMSREWIYCPVFYTYTILIHFKIMMN